MLVEGLHALNPELTNFVPGYQCMHIFLSALTQLSIDRHNRISTSDTALFDVSSEIAGQEIIRRMIH